MPRSSRSKQPKRIRATFIATILAVGVLLFLLLYKLTSLLPGVSRNEVQTKIASWSFNGIWQNPMNAPYTIPAHFLLHLMPHNVVSLRLISAMYAILIAITFFFTVKRWYNTRISLLGTALLICSTWFLEQARMGTPDILLGTVIVICGLLLWLRHTDHGKLVVILSGLSIVGLLYIPGMIWFVIAAIAVQPVFYRDIFRHTPKWLVSVVAFVVLLLCSPIGIAIVHNHSLLWSFLGFPTQLPSPLTALHRFVSVGLELFVRGPLEPGLWVGRTPLLDVFDSVLFLLGLYSMWQHKNLKRVQSLAIMFVVSYVLVALNGLVTFTVMLPFVYLITSIGIAYMLAEWFQVFPYNPIARRLGTSLIIVAVLVSCGYQLSRYFTAWPHTTNISASFDQQL